MHYDSKEDPTPESCPSKNYKNLNKKKKIEKIDLLAFRKLFQKLYYSRMCTKLQLVFQIVDFDNDGFITAQDIRIVLKHIPWVDFRQKVASDEPLFMNQVICNSQIEKFLTDLNKYMKGKGRYDFQDFVRITSDFSSDLFVGVLTLLHSQIPCSNSFYRYF
jgi:Ca2+-binding EF-hand superfamily protein